MSKAEGPFFTVEQNGPVAEITMNRPDSANAMSPDFWDDLPRILRDLSEQGTVRAAILGGAGRHFSGGMDLATFDSIAAMLKGEPGRAAHGLCQCAFITHRDNGGTRAGDRGGHA